MIYDFVLARPYLQGLTRALESAKKVCGDVAGLASWTKAMSFFYGVNKEVLPLKVSQAIVLGGPKNVPSLLEPNFQSPDNDFSLSL